MTRPEKLALLRELVSTASAVRDLVRDSELADATILTYRRMQEACNLLTVDHVQWGGEGDLYIGPGPCDPGRRAA